MLTNYDKTKFDQTTHGELFNNDLSSMTITVTPGLKNEDVIGFQRYDGSRGSSMSKQLITIGLNMKSAD